MCPLLNWTSSGERKAEISKHGHHAEVRGRSIMAVQKFDTKRSAADGGLKHVSKLSRIVSMGMRLLPVKFKRIVGGCVANGAVRGDVRSC